MSLLLGAVGVGTGLFLNILITLSGQERFVYHENNYCSDIRYGGKSRQRMLSCHPLKHFTQKQENTVSINLSILIINPIIMEG